MKAKGNTQHPPTNNKEGTDLGRADETRLVAGMSLQALIEQSLGLCIVQDERYVFANDAFTKITGRTLDELKGMTLSGMKGIVHPDDREGIVTRGRARLEGAELSPSNEFRVIHRDGSVRWVTGFSELAQYRGNPALQVLLIDITDLKQAQEELASFFDVALDLMCVGSPTEGHFTKVNPACRRMLGYSQEEFCGRPITDFIHPDDQEPTQREVAKQLEGSPVAYFENRYRHKDGRYRWISWMATPSLDGKVFAIGRDVSAKKMAEETLRNAQKLESLGVMAGGIAHDFNNLLTAVVGNLSMMATATNIAETREMAADALDACLTAKGLSQQLLTFARGGEPIVEISALGPVIEQAATFAARGQKSRCTFNIADDLHPARVDKGQLKQVLHNLTLNAAQAMPDGGVIKVRAVNVDLTAENAESLPAGAYVRVEIEDRGVGMGQDLLAKAFDPYYSTKDEGRGLGLSICHSIISGHGGAIAASSLGNGTTFTFHLPAMPGHPVPAKEKAPIAGCSSGRVLVMDDEAPVIKIATQMLAKLGYEPETVGDGKAALAAWREAVEAGRPYRAVIMDLTIPGGMGGIEAIRELKKSHPDAIAIVSSGYSNDPVMATYEDHGFAGVLIKPYGVSELATTLDRILGRSA